MCVKEWDAKGKERYQGDYFVLLAPTWRSVNAPINETLHLEQKERRILANTPNT